MMKSFFFSLVVALLLNPALASELPKVDLMAQAKDQAVYKIDAGEIALGGALVKRIEFGKGSALVTYLNKNERAVKPDFTVRLINAYGLETAAVRVSWLVQTVGAGETKSETEKFYPHDLAHILRNSGFDLPKDLDVPAYAVIEGNAVKPVAP